MDAQTPAVSSLGDPSPEVVSEEPLREGYRDFLAESKRDVARRVIRWVQSLARAHYRDDIKDSWPTREELFQSTGDDCDGLELLAYTLLLDFGFPEDAVYRAIVYRISDGQHHMVTLWFEDDEDPWVLDPTGIMSPKMRRMSELDDWAPSKIFSETKEFTASMAETP